MNFSVTISKNRGEEPTTGIRLRNDTRLKPFPQGHALPLRSHITEAEMDLGKHAPDIAD